MTRKPNFWKCIMGVLVLALLFIGTLAVTRAPRTAAAKAKVNSTPTLNSSNVRTAPAPAGGLTSIENVFEITYGDVEDIPPGGKVDWNAINPPTIGAVPGPQQFISGP